MKKYIQQLQNAIPYQHKYFFPAVILFTAALNNIITMIFEDGICPDAVTYHDMISNWMEYNDIYLMSYDTWLTTAIPPFWLWCVRTVATVFNIEIFAAARAINFVAGTLSPLVFYGIISTFELKKFFAFLCALVLACHPSTARLCGIITRDCLYLFLISLAILFIVQCGLKGKLYFAPLAGLVLSFAVLTRFESIEMMVCVFIFWPVCAADKKISWRQAIFSLLLFTIFFVAGLFLWGQIIDFHHNYCTRLLKRYLERIIHFW